MGRLIRALLILSPLRFIASFYIAGSVYGALWSHVLDGSYFMNRATDLSTVAMLIGWSIKLYNLVNVFTIHIDPMNALFYALLLVGLSYYVKEKDRLESDLSSVILG